MPRWLRAEGRSRAGTARASARGEAEAAPRRTPGRIARRGPQAPAVSRAGSIAQPLPTCRRYPVPRCGPAPTSARSTPSATAGASSFGEPTVAEAAVTVVDDVQRVGLGRLLATTLAEAARERGVHTFRADVLAVNEPMRSMMTEIGAAERATDAGVISYDVSLDTVGPTRGGPVDRVLRAAAGSMAVLLRRLGPPPSDVS